MPNIVTFLLLNPGYFCISVNIPDLCSEMQSIYLKIVWSFQGLLLKSLLDKTWAASNLRLIFPHHWDKSLWYDLPNAPWIMRFSTSAGGNRYYFHWVSFEDCFLCSFQMFFPHLRVSSLMCAHRSSANCHGEPSEDFRALSYKLAVLASLDSPVCRLSSRKQLDSVWIPPAFSLETTGNMLGQM